MTDVSFIYTINGIQKERMSLPNVIKRIKINNVMTKSFSLRKHRTKNLHDEVVSIRNTHINKYINPQTQPGDCEIIQSYTVYKPHTGRYFKYNQHT